MKNVFSLFTKNPVTAGMLVFIILFYSFFISLSLIDKKEAPSKEEVKTQTRLTPEELKQRENKFKENIQAKPALMNLIGFGVLLVFLIGLAINVIFFIRRESGASIFPLVLPQADVPWGLKDVFQAFVFIFFVEVVIVVIEFVLALFLGFKEIGQDVFLMLNSLLRNFFAAVFVIWIVKKRYQKSLSEIGLTTKKFFKSIAVGLASYVAVLPGLFVLVIGLALLVKLFSYEPPPQRVVEMYIQETRTNALLFFTFFVAVLGPLIEEVVFRGFVYKAFRSRMGVRRGILVSAFVFALMHMNFIAFLPIFVLGAFLTYLYEKTGSLVPSMAVHMTHNLIMVSMTMFFKGFSG